MPRNKSFAITLTLMLLLCAGTFTTADAQQTPAANQTSFEEPKPSMGPNEGLLKVTLRLPKGVTAPEAGLGFWINGDVKHPGAATDFMNKFFKMKKGSSSYSTYLNVPTANGKAKCSVKYTPGPAPEYVVGYAAPNGTSAERNFFTCEVKQGAVSEITLDAILKADLLKPPAVGPAIVEEPKPSMGPNDGQLKVTLRLPKGVTAPEKGFKFLIYSEVQKPGAKSTNLSKMITMGNGANTYSTYFNVAAPDGKVNCTVRYIPGAAPEYLEGYASKSGTSMMYSADTFEIKKSEVREVTLDAFKGVEVTGVIDLPPSATTSKDSAVIYVSKSSNNPTYSKFTYVNVANNSYKIPISVCLPKNTDFSITLYDVFGKEVLTENYGTISTVNAGTGRLVQNVAAKTPEKAPEIIAEKPVEKIEDKAPEKIAEIKKDGPAVVEEPKPSIGPNEGQLKITLRLPKGVKAPDKGFSFWINSVVKNPHGTPTYLPKLITMEKGANSYTIYTNVAATDGTATCFVQYLPGDAPDYLEGFASESGTSAAYINYDIAVKKGDVREINLDAIIGVNVSGVISLPAMAAPGKAIDVVFNAQSSKYSNYTNRISLKVTDKNAKIPYSLLLPRDEVFGTTIANLFGSETISQQDDAVSTFNAGDHGLTKDITIKAPEKVVFADNMMEQVIRYLVGQTTGDVYDYMLHKVTQLNLEPIGVNSLADLSKLKSLSTLTLDKVPDIAPYLKTIGSIKSLTRLELTNTTINDLSFLKNLTNLTALILTNDNMTDISSMGELTGIRYIDFSNNRIADISVMSKLSGVTNLNLSNNTITDHSPISKFTNMNALSITCSRNEDLSFIKNFRSLASIGINGGGKIRDISFLKNLNSLKQINIEEMSVYADMSILRNFPDSAFAGGKKGIAGNNTLEKIIAINEKARKILADIIKPGMSNVEKELAIHDWIVQNTKFDYEESNKRSTLIDSYTPYGVLVKGKAVSEGYAKTFNLMMNSLDIYSTLVTGATSTGAHIWNAVKLDNEYYLVCTACDDPSPDASKDISHKYFNVTSAQLKEDHSWKSKLFPVCRADRYSYFNVTGLSNTDVVQQIGYRKKAAPAASIADKKDVKAEKVK